MFAVLRLVVFCLISPALSTAAAAQPNLFSSDRSSNPAVEATRDPSAIDGRWPARPRVGVLTPGVALRCPSSRGSARGDDPSTTAALSAAKTFVAGQHFKKGISPAGEVRISWLGATFERRFAVKIERNTAAAALRIYVLDRLSRSIGIVEELHWPFEVQLADVWCLLREQPNGEDGPLLTNAVPNLFFVRDIADRLGVVDAVWSGAGWEIGASSMMNNRPWAAGLRVIAR